MHGGDNSLASLFLDSVQDSYLVKHVTKCTMHRQGQQSSLLDLVFSSDPNFIDEVSNLSALGSSDHDCLLWKYKCYDAPSPLKPNTLMFNYRKDDYQAMNDYFKEINWAEFLCSDSIEVNWDLFKQKMQDGMHGPICSHFYIFKSKTHPPW